MMKRSRQSKARVRRRIETEENAVLDFQFALLKLLKELDVTQEELASRLGVTKSAVNQQFAAGANPSLKMVARIFDALDCKVAMQAVPLSDFVKEAKVAAVKEAFLSDVVAFEGWRPVVYAANENWGDDQQARAVA